MVTPSLDVKRLTYDITSFCTLLGFLRDLPLQGSTEKGSPTLVNLCIFDTSCSDIDTSFP